MKVKDIMHAITLVKAEDSVRQAAVIMKKKNIGSVMVQKNNEIVGILTERDILKQVVAEGLDASKVKAEQITTKKLLTISADATILDASKLLNEHHIRRIPVEENGKIVGIVTARGIAKSLPLYVVRASPQKEYFQGEGV